jgi:hypothetical protein
MAFFPIHRVNRDQAESFEPLGSKPKFWFREGEKRLLFKADDRGTGEDWAEKIACELCEVLGLPHVEYELALGFGGDQPPLPGVICENMAPPPTSLVLGNQLLLAVDQQYPLAERFKVRQHTIEAVASILNVLSPPNTGIPVGIPSAIDSFIGYVMLDAWIANQDRHHENWGALVHPQLLQEYGVLQLAPTFDHGAALGRNLTDGERQERLSTKDRNRTVAAFAERGRSAFYQSEADNLPLGTLDAFLGFAERSPTAKHVWLERLQDVNPGQIWDILEQVPEERMSLVCKQFTFKLLLENQRRLLEQGNA